MSSNTRQKQTKNRLSLRKKSTTKISKSPRRSQPSLGLINHHPLPLSLTSNSTPITQSQTQTQPHKPTDIQTVSRSRSNINTPIQNIITSHKPKKININKNWKSSPINTTHTPTTPHEHIFDNNTIQLNDNDSIGDLFDTKSPPTSNISDNVSAASSISDILGPMSSLHEDSDDEAKKK
eukprot:100994_1